MQLSAECAVNVKRAGNNGTFCYSGHFSKGEYVLTYTYGTKNKAEVAASTGYGRINYLVY
jgi:hypothetical protein